VWCELNQSVVNHAINEWRRRLSACVDAEGGHCKHHRCKKKRSKRIKNVKNVKKRNENKKRL